MEGPLVPGDNPNKRNAQPRKSARPKTKNNAPKSQAKMALGWIDPLPIVDTSEALGIEHNAELFPAGEIELNFNLPTHIAQPFSDLVESVGDRIMLDDEAKKQCSDSINALSYFKCSRQLYSTMLDHEKSLNQPLKAVYYDETPIPTHMGGAISIVGHMDTKVGKVVVKNASTLFKRWICKGLQLAPDTEYDEPSYEGKGSARRHNGEPEPEKLVWPEEDGRKLAHELARQQINNLTDQRYEITVGNRPLTVSMPKLTDQPLDQYYSSINDLVPDKDQIKDLTSVLQMSKDDWKHGTISNGRNITDALAHIELVRAPDKYLSPQLRVAFEEWMASYTVGTKTRIEAIFNTGPPPAGSTGYAAQTVSSSGTVARWQFPLSDADVNIGFLFSPMKNFTLAPRIVGYSKRQQDSAAAMFAQLDGKSFV